MVARCSEQEPEVAKYWMSGEKSAHEGREARLSSLKALYWGGGSSGIGATSQENEINSDALDTGGGAHSVTIGEQGFKTIPFVDSLIIERAA